MGNRTQEELSLSINHYREGGKDKEVFIVVPKRNLEQAGYSSKEFQAEMVRYLNACTDEAITLVANILADQPKQSSEQDKKMFVLDPRAERILRWGVDVVVQDNSVSPPKVLVRKRFDYTSDSAPNP